MSQAYRAFLVVFYVSLNCTCITLISLLVLVVVVVAVLK